MEKPTVLLGMINDASIAKIVAENLRYCGFEVIDFSLDSLTFRYPDMISRLRTQWRKLTGNKQAKKELMVELKRRELREILEQHPRFDYALFIRADIYPESFLREIKEKSRLMVNYQWDGIKRFQSILPQIDLFDYFYVFDAHDLNVYPEKLSAATSFYFDYPNQIIQNDGTIYYLGAHRSDRKESIIQFCRYAQEHDLKLNFQIAISKQPEAASEYGVENITFHDGISYHDNLINARNAAILADFVIGEHQGLSLRTFEALGYRKKLITTNAQIIHYDFYHPDNIFVWDGKNLEGLSLFLQKPYQKLPEKIYQKYAFTNWVRYILNIQPNQSLNFPSELMPKEK